VRYLRFSFLVQGIQLFQAFQQQRDPFSFPYCLKMIVCVRLRNVLHSVVFPLIGFTWRTNYHRCVRLSSVIQRALRHNTIHEFNGKQKMESLWHLNTICIIIWNAVYMQHSMLLNPNEKWDKQPFSSFRFLWSNQNRKKLILTAQIVF